MAKKYYTLFVRENGGWGPQFSDEKRSVVEQEKRDSWRDTSWKDVRIADAGETQAQIEEYARGLK